MKPSAEYKKSILGVNEMKLCLSDRDKKLGGVCGGIAEHFSLEPALVRLFFVLLILLFRGLPIVVYLILWAVLPRDSRL